ncbi:LMBR1-like membrane protein-domain-containing protein [Sphaerosporella brunnea]|uniref:LMBR1-like membrane protein-domain-containing protein n=1 Tax=Sphaerosporella brunnea TaxID=1250544 RepID=A0A5J5F704_9PEZI|nr:LMBR1-like membrane protein-domain-containing protein [Sphaerosporella brunnea]
MINSAVFFALCLFFIAVVTLLLQRRYLPLRQTPEYLLVSTFLGLFLSSSIIVLVPIDLASASSTDDGSRGIVLPERVLLICWRISYWLCFVLTWAILPILLSYSDSGHRSPQKRLLQSLRENVRYHLTVLSVGTVGLIYFILSNGFHFSSLQGLLVAVSYCYALFLAISLMGHGLVSIPRGLFHAASISGTLRKLQRQAPRAYDKLIETTSNLEAVEAEVAQLRQRKTGTALQFQEWIEELAEMARVPSGQGTQTLGARSSVPQVITEEYLAALTRRLKLCIHRRARFLSEWENLVQSAADAQAILDSASSKRLIFTKHFSSPTMLENIAILNPYTRHIYHFHLLPYLRTAAACLLSAASIMIVWTELVYSAFPKAAVIRYTVVHHPSSSTGKIGFAGQCISAAWIAYMCFAAYYSLSAVKVWGSHALVRRGTSFSSACFYSSYAARLTVPLSYNFVSFLPEEGIVGKTVFYNFMGRLINLTAISEGFTDFFPVLVCIPVAASAFGLYGKVRDVCGFGDVVDDDDDEESAFSTGGWREGRDLIEREIQGSTGGVFTGRNMRAQQPNYGSSTPSSAPSSRLERSRYRDEPTREEQEDGDGEEESAWGGFVHRVRNTLETVEPPKWWRKPAAAAPPSRPPRWMAPGRG